jgi:hypothetical protein
MHVGLPDNDVLSCCEVQQRPLSLELQFERRHRVCRDLRFGGLQLPRTMMDVRAIQRAGRRAGVQAVALGQEVVDAYTAARLPASREKTSFPASPGRSRTFGRSAQEIAKRPGSAE